MWKKPGRRPKNRKKHNRLKRGGETGRDSQNRSRWKNMEAERKQATVVTACGKNAERDHKDDPEPQHAESEDQRGGKTKGSKRWNHRKSKPHETSESQKIRGKRRKEKTTENRKPMPKKETEPEQTGTSPKGRLEDAGQTPGNSGREEKQTGESRGYKDQERKHERQQLT